MPTHRVSDENLVEQFDGPRLYQQVDAGPLVHRVRRGETGASIARRYGLTLAELRAMNRRVSPLKPGMTLTVRRSQKQTVLVAEDGSRKVISRQAAVPAPATASSGSHTAIRLVHYSPARTRTGSSNTAASRSTASRLDSRVTLRSDRSATRHTLRQSGRTTVALADTTSHPRSAATASTRSTTARKSASTATATSKRLKAASASSATNRGSASGRTAPAKAASAKSASSRKAVNSSNTRASSRSTATRTKAGSSRPRASHKVADAR